MKGFPFAIVPQSDDEKFMLEALKEAWKAFEVGEVPVGAVLVKNKQIIARGNNQVEQLKDATAHAEMLCLSSGEIALDNWRLLDTTLYCTLEPCMMCLGAMYLTRISRLVWGAPDLRHGVAGSWLNLVQNKHPMHTFTVESGILKDFAAELMREFFQIRRKADAKRCLETS